MIFIFLSCHEKAHDNKEFDCMLHMRFRVNPTLYSCLNLKEVLAQNRCKIWSLSDCNWTQTHNHLVNEHSTIRKQTQTSFAKWLSAHLWIKWLWVQVQSQSLKQRIWSKKLKTLLWITNRNLLCRTLEVHYYSTRQATQITLCSYHSSKQIMCCY